MNKGLYRSTPSPIMPEQAQRDKAKGTANTGKQVTVSWANPKFADKAIWDASKVVSHGNRNVTVIQH